jgi:hypothetical protein
MDFIESRNHGSVRLGLAWRAMQNIAATHQDKISRLKFIVETVPAFRDQAFVPHFTGVMSPWLPLIDVSILVLKLV